MSDVEFGAMWTKTGRFSARVKGPMLKTLLEISANNGQGGPKVILNVLVQAYRDLQAIRAQA